MLISWRGSFVATKFRSHRCQVGGEQQLTRPPSGDGGYQARSHRCQVLKLRVLVLIMRPS